VHKLQSSQPQECSLQWSRATGEFLQRAKADAEMISNVRYGDWRASIVNHEALGPAHRAGYERRHSPRQLLAVIVRIMMQ
jgi:hypothetical protein